MVSPHGPVSPVSARPCLGCRLCVPPQPAPGCHLGGVETLCAPHRPLPPRPLGSSAVRRMSQAASPGVPRCCAPSQRPLPVARRTLPPHQPGPRPAGPDRPQPRRDSVVLHSAGMLFQTHRPPLRVQDSGGLGSGGDECGPRGPPPTPSVATGSAADTARRAERRTAPPPRPECPTPGEQRASGGEAEGIPGQEETGPPLLPSCSRGLRMRLPAHARSCGDGRPLPG